MKNLIFTLSLLVCVILTSTAQVPQLFNYQATLRDNNGQLLISKDISMRISILQLSPDGSAVYSETHETTTSGQGIVNLKIGSGSTTDDFSKLNWNNGPYFLKIEIDAEGSGSFIGLGTTQLLSVPYALFADKSNKALVAGNASYADTAAFTMESNWEKEGQNLYYLQGSVGIGTRTFDSHYNPKLWLHNGWLQVSDSTDQDAGIVVSHLNKSGYGFARTVHQVYEGVNGDPYTEFRIRNYDDNLSITSWSVGADNDDNDKFKINLRTNHQTGSSPSYGQNVFTLTKDGNVGIGTMSPISKLNIEGTADEDKARSFIRIKNNSTGPKAQTAISLHSFEDKSATLGYESSTYSMYDLADFGFLTTNGRGFAIISPTNDGQVRFYTNIDSNGPIERLRINSEGNVGIGTESPTAKLEIADGDIYIKDMNKGIILTSPDGQCWRGTINNSGVLEFVSISCP